MYPPTAPTGKAKFYNNLAPAWRRVLLFSFTRQSRACFLKVDPDAKTATRKIDASRKAVQRIGHGPNIIGRVERGDGKAQRGGVYLIGNGIFTRQDSLHGRLVPW